LTDFAERISLFSPVELEFKTEDEFRGNPFLELRIEGRFLSPSDSIIRVKRFYYSGIPVL
jgi:hypothetical protein